MGRSPHPRQGVRPQNVKSHTKHIPTDCNGLLLEGERTPSILWPSGQRRVGGHPDDQARTESYSNPTFWTLWPTKSELQRLASTAREPCTLARRIRAKNVEPWLPFQGYARETRMATPDVASRHTAYYRAAGRLDYAPGEGRVRNTICRPLSCVQSRKRRNTPKGIGGHTNLGSVIPARFGRCVVKR